MKIGTSGVIDLFFGRLTRSSNSEESMIDNFRRVALNPNHRNLDHLSVTELKTLIDDNILTKDEVKEFYNNEWWDETP